MRKVVISQVETKITTIEVVEYWYSELNDRVSHAFEMNNNGWKLDKLGSGHKGYTASYTKKSTENKITSGKQKEEVIKEYEDNTVIKPNQSFDRQV